MVDLDVTKVGGALGAEVHGVMLTETNDDATWDAVRAALAEHGVLFFRDQPMSADEQLAIMAQFGEPSIYAIPKIFGATEPVCSEIVDDADSPPATDDWHTDVSWLDTPPVAAILTALEVPAYGGDTLWVSTAAVYDALSDEMRTMIEGLQVRHSNWPDFCRISEEKSGVEGLGEKIRAEYPDVEHPLVRTHPDTGRKMLYLTSPNTGKGIVGMSDDESHLLLSYLRRQLDEPRFQCRWRWSPGDVAIWDERQTNHRGCSDHYPQRRVVRRCTADGERPY